MPIQKAFTILIAALLFSFPAIIKASETSSTGQSTIRQTSAANKNYPKIVLYSVAWCPHCKEAKEYFTANNIPFINKDVELDPVAMDELTGKYKSQGVPVVVLGNDSKILKGFNVKDFENAVQELQKSP